MAARFWRFGVERKSKVIPGDAKLQAKSQLLEEECEVAECSKLIKADGMQAVSCVRALNALQFVSASTDGAVRVWDWGQGAACVMEIFPHSAPVTSIAVLSDGRVVTGSEDRTARISSPTGTCIQVLEAKDTAKVCVASS